MSSQGKMLKSTLRRGEQFPFLIKVTASKGFDLFAKTLILEHTLLIEYKGEIIGNTICH